jgi:nucleoside 2-deoxyribosyltransferase
MPFSSSYERLYSEIKAAVVRCGYDCIRVDEQNFTRSIMQKMFDEIARAKIIIFVATDQNPNAFYEAGYAEALHKEVITVTDKYSSLPFDIRHRNAIAYKRNPAKVLALLVAMMRGLCDGTNT